ncbi:MAG: hypothetical protein CBB70_03670 [Planctomycetaceae bacterium TMED10]|nr:MAG: hypothetical protein CBB70_03670 [Planctomycetaceae bacterium TMED10]
MNRSLHCFGRVAVAAFFLANGCGSPSSSGSLQPGTEVQLIGEEAGFGKIQTSEGEVGYVPLGMLKQRNTAEAFDADHTHAIVRATDFYDGLPVEPIAPPPPRDRAAIDREQHTLNALFIGEETGREVIAPGNVHYFVVDEETGERCWRSIECIHPDCPGEKKNGRPYYVFFLVAEKPNEEEPPIECNACLRFRDVDRETPLEKTEWSRYVRPYELPETLRRRGELDDERRRFVEELRKTHAD